MRPKENIAISIGKEKSIDVMMISLGKVQKILKSCGLAITMVNSNLQEKAIAADAKMKSGAIGSTRSIASESDALKKTEDPTCLRRSP